MAPNSPSRSTRTRVKQAIREGVAGAVRFSGLPSLIRRAVARRRATILLYHAPDPEVLERHLEYLAKRYSFVSLDRIVDAIRARDFSQLPDYPLAITLDDGHRSNYACREIFQRFGVRPTIYLCSQVVDTRSPFWFNVPPADQKGALKRLPNRERLARLAEQYGYMADVEIGHGEPQALDQDQMIEMQPACDFGSHTRLHPVLTTCDDGECEREIVLSKREIEQSLGVEAAHFSYPNGDYGERERKLAEAAGYLSARTIDVGWNGVDTSPYRLRATGVTDDASINMLAAQLTGLAVYLRYVLAGSWRGRYKSIQLPEAVEGGREYDPSEALHPRRESAGFIRRALARTHLLHPRPVG